MDPKDHMDARAGQKANQGSLAAGLPKGETMRTSDAISKAAKRILRDLPNSFNGRKR